MNRINDWNLRGKTVLVRVDFNVPLDEHKRIRDDTRIRATLPTIQLLAEKGARVVLLSHLGRPKGEWNERLSLQPVVKWVSSLLGRQVKFISQPIGKGAKEEVAKLADGEVALLENIRFYAGETTNSSAFVDQLAELGDYYVNDAFGVAHRKHASVYGIAEKLPAAPGLLLQKEVEALSRLLEPERPFVAVVGGAKISDKVSVLERLLDKVDKLMIGGGMANTFLAALGYNMGKSLVEKSQLAIAERMISKANNMNKELLLPIDIVVGDFFIPECEYKTVEVNRIPPDWIALDIGPLTIERFRIGLKDAKMIFWNGPLGVAEWANFAKGTEAMARILADHSAYTVVGGGDSMAALVRTGLADKIDHVSTGGGASLEFVEGKQLPGLVSLGL